MGPRRIVPVYEGIEESPSVRSGREPCAVSLETLRHDGANDPFRFPIRVRMMGFGEPLPDAAAPQSGDEGVVASAAILAPIVGICLFHRKWQCMERFFEEYSRGKARLVREDVRCKEAGEVIHCHVEPLARLGDRFPVHHGEFLRVEVDELTGGVLLIALEAVRSSCQLFRKDFFRGAQPLQAILRLPVPMIHRGEIHEYAQAGVLERPVYRGARHAVFAAQIRDGVPVNPPPRA